MGRTIVSIVMAGVLSLVALPALATDYTVTTTEDELDGSEDCLTANVGTTNTDCSLREAIEEVNGESSGDHTITIPAGTFTITVANSGSDEDVNVSGDFDITYNAGQLTITGDGAGSTVIDGDGAVISDRVFHLEALADVEFHDVTIQNGDSTSATDVDGGCILVGSGADVVVQDTMFENCEGRHGGAIFSGTGSPSITVTRSDFQNNTASSNGGAIASDNTGTLSVTDAYFTDNSAGTGGGAVNAYSSTTIDGSTFYNNSADSSSASGAGGAIRFLAPISSTVINSSFVDNSAPNGYGGGIVMATTSASNSLTVQHVTVSGNSAGISGGGLYWNDSSVGATFTVTHSLLANNTAITSGPDCYDESTDFTSGDYNLIEDIDGCAFTGSTGNNETGVDPGLASLEDNGGEVDTIGFANYSTSDAVDAIPSGTCTAVTTVDQRGMTRPENSSCDIGAYEVDQTAPVVSVTSGTDTVECGVDTWVDAGATATDTFDTTVTTASTGDTVDETTVGGYTITYTSDADYDDNTDTDSRSVTVQDTIAPVITVTGDSSVAVEAGGSYSELGASATDACDAAVTTANVGGDIVDPNTLGAYTVQYDVTDTEGNIATVQTRTVTVSDTTKPVITLLGNGSVTLTEGDTYSDVGATATDSFDGTLTSSIVTVNPVDTAVPGVYSVTYDVSDSSGNSATQVTRTVTVEAAESDTEAKLMTSVTQSGGALVVEYEDETTDTIEPYNGKKNFLFVTSNDDTRIVTFNGKQVKVFVNGELASKKSMRKKKPTKKKHYKLKVVEYYPAKGYEVIAVMSVKKKNASVGVVRLKSDHTLKKKNTKEYTVQKKNKLKLKVNLDTQRLVPTFGTGAVKDKRNFKVTKKGKLKRKG